MKRLLEISSEERNRILEMHQNATKKNYLMEQPSQPEPGTLSQGADINGIKYKLTNAVKDAKTLSTFLNYTPAPRDMQVFCQTSGSQCSGLNQINLNPTSNGKPS